MTSNATSGTPYPAPDPVLAEQIGALIARLQVEPGVPVADLKIDTRVLEDLGLPQVHGQVYWPDDTPPLDARQIRSGLSADGARWLSNLSVLSAVGSTNDWLRADVDGLGVAGQAVTAECQTAGKGRLGRHWLTPVGGGLPLSMGLRFGGSPDALGGLSLVVGLAVVAALDPDGSTGIGLKWPNDLLVDGAKLGGILIEIAAHGQSGTEVIVGIGLNLRLAPVIADLIDRSIVDLASLGMTRNRNELVPQVINQVVRFARAFDEAGFEPFAAAFDSIHLYREKTCAVSSGQREQIGTVLNIGPRGELRVRTATGVCTFNAGEVSLREQ